MSAEEDFAVLSGLAERLGLDDNETESFISSSMKRLGYKARQMWEDGEEDGKSGGGDFFGGKNREQRPARRQGGSRWSQYG